MLDQAYLVRQKRVSFEVDGAVFKEGVRPALIVDGVLVVEVKSAKELAAVDWKQVLTYLRVLLRVFKQFLASSRE